MLNTLNTNTEILIDIPEYEGLYSISNTGKVFSHASNKYLTPIKQMRGYLSVNLYKNKTPKLHFIHRLVAKSFCENPLNKSVVNHKNFNKHDNVFTNLEWVTTKENIHHFINSGGGKGERNGKSKLTSDQINEIREKHKFRSHTYESLSNEYKVMKHYIGRIVRREAWKHI
jgi:hypothetical protein